MGICWQAMAMRVELVGVICLVLILPGGGLKCVQTISKSFGIFICFHRPLLAEHITHQAWHTRYGPLGSNEEWMVCVSRIVSVALYISLIVAIYRVCGQGLFQQVTDHPLKSNKSTIPPTASNVLEPYFLPVANCPMDPHLT